MAAASKPTVYIETTIVSYLAARPSRDLVRAAQQQITREWWQTERDQVELFTSELVFVEASAGDATAATERLAMLAALPVLRLNDAAIALARSLLAAGALPAVAIRDAEHIAIAAVHGMDFLLTWNCRHMANAFLRDRIEEICSEAGMKAPKICTPEELPGALP